MKTCLPEKQISPTPSLSGLWMSVRQPVISFPQLKEKQTQTQGFKIRNAQQQTASRAPAGGRVWTTPGSFVWEPLQRGAQPHKGQPLARGEATEVAIAEAGAPRPPVSHPLFSDTEMSVPGSCPLLMVPLLEPTVTLGAADSAGRVLLHSLV